LLNNACDSVQFDLIESIVVRHPYGCKPELRELAVPFHMNVDGVASVAGEEEKPVRPTLQDPWTHQTGFCQFWERAANSGSWIRLMTHASAAALHDRAERSPLRALVSQPLLLRPHRRFRRLAPDRFRDTCR